MPLNAALDMLAELIAALVLASSGGDAAAAKSLALEACKDRPAQTEATLARIAGQFAAEKGWSVDDYAFFKPSLECEDGVLRWWVLIMPKRSAGMYTLVILDRDGSVRFIPEG